VYYRAKDIALSNEEQFHLVAFVKNKNSYHWGVNSSRSSAKFERRYPDGSFGYRIHAEMDLIRKLPPGSLRQISVIRFKKNGDITMSKPCRYCQRFMRLHGIKKVRYTNWDGDWEVISL
jgi:hypothetical protein